MTGVRASARGRLGRPTSVVAILILLGLAPLGLSPYQTQVVTFGFYYVILGISFNLIAGFTGQFSVAQHAIATLSAYTSAGVILAFGMPIPVGLLAGIVAAALVGYGLGSVVLRSRGIYFALSTWAFAETTRILIAQNYQVTKGDNGLPVPFLLGTLDPTPYYYLFLFASGFTLVLSIVVLRMKIGLRMRAIRDDEEVAVAIGISAFKWKRYVFTLSAALAGLGGVLYGHTVGLLTPSQANFKQMMFIIICVVLGGYRTIWGPVVGALLVQGFAEVLRFSEQFRLIIFAVLVILIVRFYPPGIMGGLAEIGRRMTARRIRRSCEADDGDETSVDHRCDVGSDGERVEREL